MQSLLNKPYGLLLFVLMLAGIEFFIWFYLAKTGVLQNLIWIDASHVSLVIIFIYSLASLRFLFSSYATSRQFLDLDKGSESYKSPLLETFFYQITSASVSHESRLSLLEVLDTRLRSKYALGFLVADLMLKLGLLGTVIGFIIMLGSLSNLNSVDITVMQTLLAEMSSGMKVALYTTLTGMLAGITLNFKFNLLDWAVDHLLNDIKEQVSIKTTSPSQ